MSGGGGVSQPLQHRRSLGILPEQQNKQTMAIGPDPDVRTHLPEYPAE